MWALFDPATSTMYRVCVCVCVCVCVFVFVFDLLIQWNNTLQF